MTQEKIERINLLAKKSRSEGLTEEEKDEQARLRTEYVSAIKASLTGQLDNTYIVSPDGSRKKLERRKK